MKRYTGIRHIEGNSYEINFRPFKKAKRVFKRVQAGSMQEAYAKRAEEMVMAQKLSEIPFEEEGRLIADFSEVWQKLNAGLLSDQLPAKTILRYKKTFGRLFVDFRGSKFQSIKNPSQLSLLFFEEYKNYYCVDLDRPMGWRSELIIVKAIMRRIYRIGYCKREMIEKLSELKKPRAVKKEYPDICKSKINELLLYIKKDRPDFYKPIYFMLRTGRRVEETTLIERRDIAWEGLKPIRIDVRAETTKTKVKAPLDILDSELENFIRQAYNESASHKAPWLFLNRQRKKCNQRRICDYLKEVSNEIFKTEITPHYFRHRFFTECGKNNLPIVDVMAISGLKDPDIMVRYYSHSTAEGKRNVLEMSRV